MPQSTELVNTEVGCPLIPLSVLYEYRLPLIVPICGL